VWYRIYSFGGYLLAVIIVLPLVFVVWAVATRPQREAATSVNALIHALDTSPTAEEVTTLNSQIYRREIAIGADPLDTNGVLYKLENSVTRALADWNSAESNHLSEDLCEVRSCAVRVRDEGARRDVVTPPDTSTATLTN
jgi:hypothetical protein